MEVFRHPHLVFLQLPPYVSSYMCRDSTTFHDQQCWELSNTVAKQVQEHIECQYNCSINLFWLESVTFGLFSRQDKVDR